MTNVALQLVFINILFELFFVMTLSLMILEMMAGCELFQADIAFEVRAFLFNSLSLWNVKRGIQKLLNFVMGYSNMTHQPVSFFVFIATNGATFPFKELFETLPEVANAVVIVKLSSLGKWFVITETTGGLVSGSSWNGLRL